MSRIAKLVRTLKKYENFAALKPLLSLGTLVGIILLAAHLLACFWYLIGTWGKIVILSRFALSALANPEKHHNRRPGHDPAEQ